jgi:hypothetical protein
MSIDFRAVERSGRWMDGWMDGLTAGFSLAFFTFPWLYNHYV